MGRVIGAAIVGYLVIFGIVFFLFSGAYLALGPDRAFQPGTYDVSMLWNALSIVLGFVAAVVGGMVAMRIARDSRGPKALAALVLILGIAFAIPVMQQPASSEARTAEVGNLEAMGKARQPVWAALLSPVLGVVGVLVGGRRRTPTVA